MSHILHIFWSARGAAALHIPSEHVLHRATAVHSDARGAFYQWCCKNVITLFLSVIIGPISVNTENTNQSLLLYSVCPKAKHFAVLRLNLQALFTFLETPQRLFVCPQTHMQGFTERNCYGMQIEA